MFNNLLTHSAARLPLLLELLLPFQPSSGAVDVEAIPPSSVAAGYTGLKSAARRIESSFSVIILFRGHCGVVLVKEE